MRKQRGWTRGHVHAPITRHGGMGRLADHLELRVIAGNDRAKSFRKLLATPFAVEHEVAIRWGEIRGQSKRLIVSQRRINVGAEVIAAGGENYANHQEQRKTDGFCKFHIMLSR